MVHVDDILLVCDKKVRDLIQRQLSECFPVEEWDNDTFDFIGSHAETKSEGIFVSQANYAALDFSKSTSTPRPRTMSPEPQSKLQTTERSRARQPGAPVPQRRAFPDRHAIASSPKPKPPHKVVGQVTVPVTNDREGTRP